jgi:hypothetical protein
MPNRILKDSICTSDTIDGLTDAEECFFYRLLVQCDDYGRMDARPAVLRARLYPMRIDRVSCYDINQRLEALEVAGLICRYEAQGKAYLQVTTWEAHQQVRAKHSKFPPMLASDSTCNQMPADASTCARESRSENTRNENREASSDAHNGAREAAAAEGEESAVSAPADSSRPYLADFLRDAWTPAFPGSPLIPTTYSDPAALDALEAALRQFTRAPDGVAGIIRELAWRLDAGNHNTFRDQILTKITQSRGRRWQVRVLGYLTGTLNGIFEEVRDGGAGSTDAGGRAGTGSAAAGGAARRSPLRALAAENARIGRRGESHPAPPGKYDGIRGGIRGLDDADPAADHGRSAGA